MCVVLSIFGLVRPPRPIVPRWRKGKIEQNGKFFDKCFVRKRKFYCAQRVPSIPIYYLGCKMRVLCIGVGGVGEAIARIAKDREFITLLVLAGELWQ